MDEDDNRGSGGNGLDEVEEVLRRAPEIPPSPPEEPPKPSPRPADRFTPEEWKEILRLHALPPFELDRQIEEAAGKLGCRRRPKISAVSCSCGGTSI
jgi:hypothetical protein